MSRDLPLFTACLFAANCTSTNVPQDVPPPPPMPQPAGYADGTKTLSTEALIFAGQTEGVVYLFGLAFAIDTAGYSYRTTADPDTIIASLWDEEFTLTYDASSGLFTGENGKSLNRLIVSQLASTADGQAALDLVGFAPSDMSSPPIIFYSASGLETDPTQVSAQSGTATFNGAADLLVFHGDNDILSSGNGQVVLTADFDTGMISGAMSVADDGSGTPGYEMSSTTITFDPAAISGNSFTGTFSANPGDLKMTSISSTSVDGKFYGVDAADVAGTFVGSGVSADNSTSATIVGGFIGE